MIKGVNYDLGWHNGTPEGPSTWDHPSLIRELTAIRDELHCNTVKFLGTDIDRLMHAATEALERGLAVWLQPRLIDNPLGVTQEHVVETAQAAEKLRERYGNVTLNIGCELMLLSGELVPAENILDRIEVFSGPGVEKAFERGLPMLNEYLAQAQPAVRAKFHGPITYSAAEFEWDAIDWSGFDMIDLDLYLTAENEKTYVEPIHRFRKQYDKPIVIGEFGCTTFAGADKMGGMGWSIVDYTADVPKLAGDYVRSEQTQADYAIKCLNAVTEEKVAGAFWYQFIERDTPHNPDEPKLDLDMASYGLVKPQPGEHDAQGALVWEPKLAFHAMADFFGSR